MSESTRETDESASNSWLEETREFTIEEVTALKIYAEWLKHRRMQESAET